MFLTADVKRFFAAWQALRTRGGIPHYRALFEGLPPELIPQVLLFELTSSGGYVVRFMGTTLVDLLGEDLTGKERLSQLPRRTAVAAARDLGDILKTPCGLIGTWPARPCEVEAVVLPAANDKDKLPRVVAFGKELAPADFEGLAEAPAELHERRWTDIGFGVPKRRPASRSSL